MSELIIVCGLMGCGKSTFAKEYSKKHKYEYIDFDGEYHENIGAKHYPYDVKPEEDIPKFIVSISKMLNNNPNNNFIIDNWFKWKKFWFKDIVDRTIQELRNKIKHEIKIIYMFVPIKIVLNRYLEKHKKAGTERDIINNYATTMKERQENMLKKIGVVVNG